MTSAVIRYELDLEEPDESLLKYASEQINEDPDIKPQILLEFKNFILERGECCPHRTDDVFLLRFLRTRNFVVPRAHRLLVNYYEFRERNKEFYEGVNLNILEHVSDKNIVQIMPFLDDKERRVLIYKLGAWDPEIVTFQQLMQATLALIELGTLEPKAQIIGGVCIFDVGSLYMKHLVHLTTKFISQMLDIVSRTYPLRIQAVHIVNESFIFNIGFSVLKPFLSKEMREKLICHGKNWSSLHDYINPQYLPTRYGGIHCDYGTAEWVKNVKSNVQALNELCAIGYVIDKE